MSSLSPLFFFRLRCRGAPRLRQTSLAAFRTPFARGRSFHSSYIRMSDLSVELTAPNGRKYTQPLGLFINNEFVKSKSGEKIVSINPT